MNRKNRIANLVMVAVIAVIAAAGILLAGHILGWFDKAEEAAATAVAEQGLADLQRDGLSIPLREKTVLRDGDTILTQPDSRVAVTVGDSLVTLGERARVSVKIDADGSVTLQPDTGELYAETNQTPIAFLVGGQQLLLSDTTAALSFRTGSATVGVLSGSVSAGETQLPAGQAEIFTDGQSNILTLRVNALSDFFLLCAAESTHALCFTAAQLQDVTDARQQVRQSALEALSEDNVQQPDNAAGADSGSTAPSPDPSAVQENPTEEPDSQDGTSQDNTSKDTAPKDTTPKDTTPHEDSTPAPDNTSLHCTIEIRCDTILGNMANLEPGKDVYVPANGTILSTTRVSFSEGETVFDILKRACSAAGLPIEYSYTPMYGSYYIEGINNLYEFDCGNESGWMYQVNGWFPNYGCSEYTLSDGDVIVWCYTCNGLGADVGGSIY